MSGSRLRLAILGLLTFLAQATGPSFHDRHKADHDRLRHVQNLYFFIICIFPGRGSESAASFLCVVEARLSLPNENMNRQDVQLAPSIIGKRKSRAWASRAILSFLFFPFGF